MNAGSQQIVQADAICTGVKHLLPPFAPAPRSVPCAPPSPPPPYCPSHQHQMQPQFLWMAEVDIYLTPGSFDSLPLDCKFTCHPECRSLIQLDCRQKEGSSLGRRSPEITFTPTFNQVSRGAHRPGWRAASVGGTGPYIQAVLWNSSDTPFHRGLGGDRLALQTSP